MRRAWVWAAAAVLACAALPPPVSAAAAPPLTRAQMEAGLSSESWLFVYGTRDPDVTPLLESRARMIARRLFGLDSTRVRADYEVKDAELARSSLVLIGAPRENAITRRLAADLPVRFEAHAFVWQGTRYAQADDAIHLVYPNPRGRKHFLLLIAGNSGDALGRHGGYWFGDSDWRIFRNGEIVRSGSFSQTAASPWRYDPALDRDRERERARFAKSLVVSGGRGIRLHAAPGAGDVRALRAGAEVVLARMDAMGFGATDAKPIDVTVYASLEQKGEMVRDTRPGSVDDAGGVHEALQAGWDRADGRAVAAARLLRLGAVRGPWLEPAAAWLAGRFEGETLEQSLARLYFGRVLPRPGEAAADPGRWRSPLIGIPARALLVRAVYETAGRGGPAAVRRLLAMDDLPGLDAVCVRARVPAAAVRARYSGLADSLARIGRGERAERRPRAWRPSDGFQSGVCLAHAVDLDRGYLSKACAGELRDLHAMGANWVSLTPFGYLPSTDTPVIRPSTEGGVNEETDEAIVEAGAHARAAGLRVWLKPHLWTRGWVGDLHFSAAGWTSFFEQYREWILHYAIIAEREGFDGLVVGHELATASLGFPDRWRALIGDVRRIYDGTLTYGANWGDEVEKIAFWDALDMVGVSFYEPLADARTSSVETLRAGAEKALNGLRAVGERAGKPVLLAEVGYAPMDDAALRPWEERQGKIDLEAQRACYEALVGALDHKPWIAGAFFWKWYTSPDMGGPDDASFTPQGKPAEAVMRRAFRAWTTRRVAGR